MSSEERRLLQGDPTLVDNEIQQLKTMVSSLTAKVAEQGREIATLRTKGTNSLLDFFKANESGIARKYASRCIYLVFHYLIRNSLHDLWVV